MDATTKISEAQISENLVGRIVGGDRLAESEMIERYNKGLFTVLYNRSRDKSLAEDITQATWVLVLEKIRENKLRDHQKLASFIIQIGKNQLIMKYRKSSRVQYGSEDELQRLADSSPTPEQQLDANQFGTEIIETLGNMSINRDSEILRRFYLVGDSKKEICEDFALSAAHFDRVLYRARERFKDLWLESVRAEE